MTNEQRVTLIRERLSNELNPTTLNVVDQSSHHVGHAGAQTGAGHFAVQITAAAFALIAYCSTTLESMIDPDNPPLLK